MKFRIVGQFVLAGRTLCALRLQVTLIHQSRRPGAHGIEPIIRHRLRITAVMAIGVMGQRGADILQVALTGNQLRMQPALINRWHQQHQHGHGNRSGHR